MSLAQRKVRGDLNEKPFEAVDFFHSMGYTVTMNSTQLTKILNSGGIAFVRFRKLNNEIRNMVCTTNIIHIPRDLRPHGFAQYDKNSQIRVFDLVAKEWRSMKPDNILEVVEYPSKVGQNA